MSQVKKLFKLLKNGDPYRTDYILHKVYGNNNLGIARISARIYDIKKKIESQGYTIKCKKDKDVPTLHWYQIVKINNNPKQQKLFN